MHYYWYPITSTPLHYPVEIFNSYFLLPGGEKVEIPRSSVLHNGWGAMGAVHLVGEDEKPIPVSLHITWYSYIEDKFYSGVIALPVPLIESYLKQGFTNPLDDMQKRFEYLNVGTSPGGGVSLWVEGGLVHKEILHQRVPEASIKWSDYHDMPETERAGYRNYGLNATMKPAEIKEYAGLINPDLWTVIYRKDYKWNLEIHSVNSWTKTFIHYFNAANELVYAASNTLTEPRLLPQSIRIYWTPQGQGKEKAATIEFNEQEITAAFRELSALQKPVTLQIELNNSDKTLKGSLKNDTQLIDLNLSKITFHNIE